MEWSHKSLRVFGHFLSKSATLVRAGQFWQVRTRPKKCEHQFVLLLGGHTLSVHFTRWGNFVTNFHFHAHLKTSEFKA